MSRKLIFPAFAVLALLLCRPAVSRADQVEDGRILFSSSGRCNSCHLMADNHPKETGPYQPERPDVTRRHSDEWLAKWVHDPQKTWEENDPETQEVKKRLGKKPTDLKADMKKLKNLTDYEEKAVIAYLVSLASLQEAEGKVFFEGAACNACHSAVAGPQAGPTLEGISKRRTESALLKSLRGHERSLPKVKGNAPKKMKPLSPGESRALMAYLRTL